jgi:hypothetical protein
VRFNLLVVGFLLFLSVGIGIGTAQSAGAATPEAPDEVQVEYVITEDGEPETVQIRVDATIPSDVPRLESNISDTPAGFTLESTNGFTEEDNTLKWDGVTTAPSFTYRVDATQSGDYGVEMTYGDSWQFIPRSNIGLHFNYWYYGDTPGLTHPIRIEQPGYAGPDYAFIGNHSVVYDPAAGFRVIVPETVSLNTPPEEIIRTLNSSQALLGVETDVTMVNVFVAPSALREGGRAAGGVSNGETGTWVHETTQNAGVDNIWIHEYIHTQQQFRTEPDMDWFIEGSAEYYGSLHPLYQNEVSFSEFRGELIRTSSMGTLGKPETWMNNAEYDQGSRVVAALDGHIRADTNGASSMAAILNTMNQHPDAVSLSDFKTMVTSKTGNESLGPWIETHVNTPKRPPIPMDDTRYEQVGPVDSDGDGVAIGVELTEGTNPSDPDTDGDGLDDGRERTLETDPLVSDTDGDGLTDGREIELGIDPLVTDTDGDTIPDAEEVELETNPAVTDTDGDGLDDGRERTLGINLRVADTDGDGLTDGREIELGIDPLVTDTDGDGLSDAREYRTLKTDPLATDTDGDGLTDDVEIGLDTDPTRSDTDNDGLSDHDEHVVHETSPLNANTDGDMFSDAFELEIETSPTEPTRLRDLMGVRLTHAGDILRYLLSVLSLPPPATAT